MCEQPVEQKNVGSGLDAEEKIGIGGRCCTSRVYCHDSCAAPLPRVGQATEQNRMAPGGVGADEDDEIGLVEVLVAARHDIFTEGTFVAGDRGRHA
jgi:hypothetical protein